VVIEVCISTGSIQPVTVWDGGGNVNLKQDIALQTSSTNGPCLVACKATSPSCSPVLLEWPTAAKRNLEAADKVMTICSICHPLSLNERCRLNLACFKAPSLYPTLGTATSGGALGSSAKRSLAQVKMIPHPERSETCGVGTYAKPKSVYSNYGQAEQIRIRIL